MGFRPRWEAEQGHWKLKYRLGISAVVLLTLSIPLFLTLRKAAIEVAIRSSVRNILSSAFHEHESSVSHLDFSHLQNGLLIRATLETTQYLGSKAIDDVQADLKHHFGSGTTLRINQILVTQGGVTAPLVKNGQNAISGGVVQSVNEKPPFNFTDSARQNLAFASDKINTVLAGTNISQIKNPEMDLGSTPLILQLRLSSAQPLNPQTLSLLAAQISAKLGAQVVLHGSSRLTGSPFAFTVSQPNANRPLTAAQRRSLLQSLKALQAQVIADQLHLNIDCRTQQATGKQQPQPRFLADIQLLLKQSGLKDSQWTLKTTPPAPHTASPSPPRCSMQSYQNF